MDVEQRQQTAFDIREFRISEDSAAAAEILKTAVEATPWSEADLRRMGELTGAAAYIATNPAGVIGIVIGRRVADEGEILNLAVRQDARRKNTGTMLVGRMLERFQQEGITRVFLEVRESNWGAIAFYERLGFRASGTRKDYYQDPKEGALIMKRPLGNSTE